MVDVVVGGIALDYNPNIVVDAVVVVVGRALVSNPDIVVDVVVVVVGIALDANSDILVVGTALDVVVVVVVGTSLDSNSNTVVVAVVLVGIAPPSNPDLVVVVFVVDRDDDTQPVLHRTQWFYIVRGFDGFGQMAGIDFDHELKGFPLGADHPIADNLMTDKEYQLKVVGAGSEHPHFEFVVIAEAREKHTLWSNWVHHLSLVHNMLQSEKTGWCLIPNEV